MLGKFFLRALVLLAALGSAEPLLKSPSYQPLPPLAVQAELQDSWTAERLSNVPHLLRKYEVDAWIVSQREYAEDTTFWHMKKATQFSARRRTLSLFMNSRFSSVNISHTWIDNTPTVWKELREVLESYDPAAIAVNVDADIAFSGGLHAGELFELQQQLGSPWTERLVKQPMLAVEFVATVPEFQIGWYRLLMETAWAMIEEAFSERVITPGHTTTNDVVWWFREKLQAMNYTTWFHPTVTILNKHHFLLDTGSDGLEHKRAYPYPSIEYGDLLHVDFGVTALGLNTDTQHLAYVQPPWHSHHHHSNEVPEGYLAGLRAANRLQDLTRSHMRPGLTGNEILHNIRAQMSEEKLEGKIYCHPTGPWGHSAGTVIGMTNLQDGVPVLGDLPLLTNTYYSVELYAEVWVEEMKANMQFPLEEDVYWEKETETWEWVHGRQETFHVVKAAADREVLMVQE